jgi:hypothetical protein
MALYTRLSRITVSLPSPVDKNTSNFQNVLSSNLEFQKMDKVQKPSDSECYTVSSGSFRFNTFSFTDEQKIHIQRAL